MSLILLSAYIVGIFCGGNFGPSCFCGVPIRSWTTLCEMCESFGCMLEVNCGMD